MKATNLIFIVVIVGVFYVLMIMPQRRQQKKRQELMNKLSVGAHVMSAGGIYGEVTEVFDDSVLLEVADGVEIKMDRRSVVRVLDAGQYQAASEVEEDEPETDGQAQLVADSSTSDEAEQK